MKVEIKKDETFAPVTLSITMTTREEYAVLERFFKRAAENSLFYVTHRPRRLHPVNAVRYAEKRQEYPLIKMICEQLRTFDEPAPDGFAKVAQSYWED